MTVDPTADTFRDAYGTVVVDNEVNGQPPLGVSRSIRRNHSGVPLFSPGTAVR